MNEYPEIVVFEVEEPISEDIYPSFDGKLKDYDVLNNKPTFGGVPLQNEMSENPDYFDKAPTLGSRKLLDSHAIAEALEKNKAVAPEVKIDETLSFQDGVLSVNTTDKVEKDNTLPITSAGVATTVGNIEILLQTI